MPEILIRAWKSEDMADLSRNINNKKIWDMVRDRLPNPYTESHARDWIKYTSTQNPVTEFAIIADGAVAGGIGLIMHNDVYRCNAEMGYWMAEHFWGKGIATAAVQQFLILSFQNFSEIHRIYCGVMAHNIASLRVLQKSGMRREGILKEAIFKNGKFIDEHIFAITRIELNV